MSTSNQQTLADSGANERPPMLEKGNYIPLESRLRRFLDNKLEDGERMWNSIQNGPYKRPMNPNPNNDRQEILEPLSKMTARNKSQFIADVKEMWERIKRLMFGSEVTSHVRHSRLMDEFDKFAAKEGESLESVYERLTTLVNIIDRNNVRPISVSINTKFLNCLQHEWSKYVTMVRHNQTGDTVSYDVLYDSLVQFKPHVLASRAKNAGRQNRNQAFNAGAVNDESNKIVQRVPLTESIPRKANVQCYNCNEKGHYACDCRKRIVRDAKYYKEQMLLAMKDEAGSNLNDEEKDFMLDNSYGEETMEDLTVAVILMARFQPADGNAETVPSYDAKAVSEVNASSKVHEQVSHVKCKTIIQTSDDGQIDSNIIFDDPCVENNGGTSEHDSNAHDEYHEIQMLAHNVQREAENQK
ncbi:copia protein [Tanacetum coccineum]